MTCVYLNMGTLTTTSSDMAAVPHALVRAHFFCEGVGIVSTG
jgi:hypothetical protein